MRYPSPHHSAGVRYRGGAHRQAEKSTPVAMSVATLALMLILWCAVTFAPGVPAHIDLTTLPMATPAATASP